MRLVTGAPDVGLVVFDSATLHYRLELHQGDDVGGRRQLATQLHQLTQLARKRDIPVVVTNQVTTNLETDELEPLGGQIVRHMSKAIVRLEKVGPSRRRATVLKHRSVAELLSAEFRITTRGLVGDGDDASPLVALGDDASPA